MQRGKRRSWRPLVLQNEPATLFHFAVLLLKLVTQALVPEPQKELVPQITASPLQQITSPFTDNFQEPHLKTNSCPLFFIAHRFHSKSLKMPNVEPALSPSFPQVWNEINQSSRPLFRFWGCGNTGFKAGYSLSHKHFSSAPDWIPAIFHNLTQMPLSTYSSTCLAHTSSPGINWSTC